MSRWRRAYKQSDYCMDVIFIMISVIEFTAYATVIVWFILCQKNNVSVARVSDLFCNV